MNLLQVTILSIVEGLTEFLPVSSTGHLILTSKILNITQTDFVKSFEIYIQLGAIMAVTYIYFSLLWKKKSILLKITAAFLPSAFIGLLFYRYIKEILLGNSYITVISLFWGGIILIVIEKISKNKTAKILALENISLEKAIVI